MLPPHDAMLALVGHQFPGGTYRIAHWENVLFHDATRADASTGSLAHPAILFHLAINGAGTSIEELFALARSDPADAMVSIGYYDWQLHQQLREEQTYYVEGSISAFERSTRENRPVRDTFTYSMAVADEYRDAVADVEYQWHFWRTVGEEPT